MMMIELGGGTVSILYADGTSAFFDPEELRQRLEKSFASANRTDPSLAGEIVLAVEYALRCRNQDDNLPDSVIHVSDIDEYIRALNNVGFTKEEVVAHLLDCDFGSEEEEIGTKTIKEIWG